MIQPNHQKLNDAVALLNLRAAASKVANAYRTQNYAGSPDEALLKSSLPGTLADLREAVLDGSYRFQPLRAYYSLKPSGALRMETISSAFDRVLIQALLNHPGCRLQQALSASATYRGRVVAPAYRFRSPYARYAYSYWPADYRAYRAHALRMAKWIPGGCVLHADIQTFFPSVSRARVRALLEPWIGSEVWPWIDRYLDFRIRNGAEVQPLWDGLPIEEPTSLLLANLYLEELDRYALQVLNVPYCRYVDDLMLFLPNQDQARETRYRIEEFLGSRLGLTLNSQKVEILPVREVADANAAAFGRRLSVLNANIRWLPVQPALRTGLIRTLMDLVNDMPSPNAEVTIGSTRRLRATKFAIWRLAKIQARRHADRIALLLRDPRTRSIAGISLAYLGTPSALRLFSEWFREEGGALSAHERRVLAAALARNGHLVVLDLFEPYAKDESQLRAIVRLYRGRGRQWTRVLEDPDALVRRAGALHMMGRKGRGARLLSRICGALDGETDRDTILALATVASVFPQSERSKRLLERLVRHPDALVARAATRLLKVGCGPSCPARPEQTNHERPTGRGVPCPTR